jgi:hypothetical protein
MESNVSEFTQPNLSEHMQSNLSKSIQPNASEFSQPNLSEHMQSNLSNSDQSNNMPETDQQRGAMQRKPLLIRKPNYRWKNFPRRAIDGCLCMCKEKKGGVGYN